MANTPTSTSGRTRPLELISGCRHQLTKHLLGYITPAFEVTSEKLFGEAEKAPNNELQNDLFAALNVLRNNKTLFTERLAQAVEHSFDIFTRDTAAQGDDTNADDQQELALVDQRDLDLDLAITEIVSKAEIKHTQAIYALNQRLAVLNRGQAVKNDTNPCGPTTIGQAIRRAATCLDLPVKQKVQLFRAFDRQAQKGLGECYQQLNDTLAQAGILPNIKLDSRVVRPQRAKPSPSERGEASTSAPPENTVQQGAAAPPTDAPQTAAPSPTAVTMAAVETNYEPEIDFFGRALRATGHPTMPAATASPATATAGAPSLATDLRQLLAQTQAPLPPAGGEGRVTAPAQSIQQALSNLQSHMAKPRQKRAFNIDQLKQQLLDSLGNDPATGKAFTLSQGQAQTIDLMGLLYDHIHQEDDLHQQVQGLLEKLQLPMIKAAIHDDAFFDNGQHPARQLFNTIADAGELWLEDDPNESHTLKKMNVAVDRVLDEYRDDATVFKELLEDLNKHIRVLGRKATIAERRHVEKARGQEKLELARERAKRFITKLIKRYQPPKFIESLLRVPWSDYLALTVLRHGDESDEWDESIKLARILIYSVRNDLDEAAKNKVRQNLDWLHQELSTGLSQVGYFDQDIKAVLKTLSDCHQWSLADHSPAQTETEPEVLSQPLPSTEEAVPDEPDSATEQGSERPSTVDKPELSERENQVLAKLRLTTFGTWFELKEEQSGEWVKRKLSWYSPVTDRCLFINNRGAMGTQMNMYELAQAMAANRARVYRPHNKPMLDRALDAVFGRLKKLAKRTKTA